MIYFTNYETSIKLLKYVPLASKENQWYYGKPYLKRWETSWCLKHKKFIDDTIYPVFFSEQLGEFLTNVCCEITQTSELVYKDKSWRYDKEKSELQNRVDAIMFLGENKMIKENNYETLGKI